MYYSIVFRFHIIGVQVTIGRLGKYQGTKSRQQQLAESVYKIQTRLRMM